MYSISIVIQIKNCEPIASSNYLNNALLCCVKLDNDTETIPGGDPTVIFLENI